MAFYEWQDKFSVGIKEMDDQHKKLIGIINQLNDAMIAGKAKTEVGKIVEEMIDYTHFHFAAEEKLMEQYHYAGLAAQRVEHNAFIAKTNQFQAEINSGKLAVSVEVLSFLKEWLTNHIMGNDKKYSGMMSK